MLAEELPQTWKGYRPDCYFNFDEEGFDKDAEGSYTGWRAFRYYPFLGTFWPTNGSTDDVLIRLDTLFTLDENNTFDKEVYKLNLAIVEALVKQKEIAFEPGMDEDLYGVDLNYNGIVDMTKEQVEKIMVGGLPHGLDFYVTPRFETSHENYQWLTRIQAVGRGSVRCVPAW